MNIGLVFPTRSRVERVQKLVNSLNFNENLFTVNLCLGLNNDDTQYNDYLNLINNINDNSSGSVNMYHIDLPKWKGLGYAFNYLSKEVVKNLPHIETLSMFGDDMLFDKNCNSIMSEVKQTLCIEWGPDNIGCVSFNHKYQHARPNEQIAINGFVSTNWKRAVKKFIPSEFYGDYSDNWLTNVSKGIGRYKFIQDCVIEHQHGMWTPKYRDETYSNKNNYDKQQRKKPIDIWNKQQNKIPDYISKLNKYIQDYVPAKPDSYFNPKKESIKLSILIPTLKERKEQFLKLLERLYLQIKKHNLCNKCEILFLIDNREMSVGKKRNILKDSANGEYIVYIDDDDLFTADWFSNVFEAFKSNPDCVTYQGVIQSKIAYLNNTKFIHNLNEKQWRYSGNGIYYRAPNHINVLRKENIKGVKFENKDVGEDYKFSQMIYPKLKNQVHIPKVQYIYRFDPERSVQNMNK